MPPAGTSAISRSINEPVIPDNNSHAAAVMSGKVISALDAALNKGKTPGVGGAPIIPSDYKPDESGAMMKAAQWHGKKSVKCKESPRPTITDPRDIILRVTSTAICGSDLHMYCNAMPGMKSGDIVGHEFMGFVEEVGPEVKNFTKGDRVLVAFDIKCGDCFFCSKQLYSSCDKTNPSEVMEFMYGQRTAGIFGYSHLTGGYAGGQAEYTRVPLADENCMKVPAGMTDNQVLFLTDILPTAWHANELGEVGPGDVVAIWGAGPVGILAAHCAQHRGARRVILIDNVAYRLEYAQQRLPGLEVINFKEKDTFKALKELCANEPGRGPDVVIEAVGFHYAKSWLHTVEVALQLETDSGDMLNELITSVRKGGRISIIGVYAGYVNHLNIGAFMEKQLTMRGGQTPVQKYWNLLLEKVQAGQLHPDMVITHVMPLEQVAKGYELFNDKKDGCVKVVLKTAAAEAAEAPAGPGIGQQ